MGEELERRHHFVVGIFVAEVDVVYLLEGVKDEETASMLGGADVYLVVKVSVPKRLEFPLFPCFSLFGDRWVVFVEGGIVVVKQSRYPRFVLVGRVGEYKAGDFYSCRSGKADQ